MPSISGIISCGRSKRKRSSTSTTHKCCSSLSSLSSLSSSSSIGGEKKQRRHRHARLELIKSSLMVMTRHHKRHLHPSRHQHHHRFITSTSLSRRHRRCLMPLPTLLSPLHQIVFNASHTKTSSFVIDHTSTKKRRREESSSSSSRSSHSSSLSSSTLSSMKRQLAHVDLSILSTSVQQKQQQQQQQQLSLFSTQNKYLFNSTCSSCLALNCDHCCKQFQLKEANASTRRNLLS